MISPHCGIGTGPDFSTKTVGWANNRGFVTSGGNCSECQGLIVFGRWQTNDTDFEDMLLYPIGPQIRPIDPTITGEYAADFREACSVINLSPKASAAISRRLLQHIIREKAGIRKRNLDDEINAVIAQGLLPPDLADDLDMIRTIGNFAAHPIKSTNTGEVVGVEPGEAEVLLDVLGELLEFYFVRPLTAKSVATPSTQS